MIQSPLFWLILAGSAVICRLLPPRWRVGFVALVSFGYLIQLDPVNTTALLAWALSFYFLAPASAGKAPRGKWIGRALILGVLTYLAYYKYIPPLIDTFAHEDPAKTIILPLGISYFTFKLIHYAVEVGRGNIKDRSLPNFLCYIFLFPIFSAGPIERFDHFLAERKPHADADDVAWGVTRIAHGLIKTFVLCEMVLPLGYGEVTIASLIGDGLAQHSLFDLWRYFITALLIVYLNFSGYSDIAIGTSRLFGFRIAENFNWPIFAPTIAEFWKRWHITLANWCMSYIYMPVIGVTRKPVLAVYATFIGIGLWHAGSLHWVTWGAYHGTGMIVLLYWSRYWKRRKWTWPKSRWWRAVATLLTFAFVTAGIVFVSLHGEGRYYDAVRVFVRLTTTLTLPT